MSDIRNLLLAPLPPEALKQHPTRSYLTTINAIYVTERFNDVFGIDGWKFRTEIVKDDGKWVVVQVFFVAESIERSAFGGNDNEDVGDRYKGAVTDALTKIGSMLGVGSHVWKNENVPGRSARPTEHKSAEQVAQGSNTAVPQGEPEEWLNVLDKQGRFTTLGLEYAERVYAKEMTVKDVRKLFKLSRVNAEALENWRPARPAQASNPAPNHHVPSYEKDGSYDGQDLPF
jgi:hypothetical protein